MQAQRSFSRARRTWRACKRYGGAPVLAPAPTKAAPPRPLSVAPLQPTLRSTAAGSQADPAARRAAKKAAAFRQQLVSRGTLKPATVDILNGLADWWAALNGWMMLLEEGERPALLRQLQRLRIDAADCDALADAVCAARIDGSLPPPQPAPERSLDEVTATAIGVLWPGGTGGLSSATAAGDNEGAQDAAAQQQRLRDLHAKGSLVEALEGGGMAPWEVRMLVGTLEGGTRSLRLGFYSNQLCERGTETALYDYAHYAEALLGCTSFILYIGASPHNVPSAVDKFRRRFGDRVIALEGDARSGRERDRPRGVAEALRSHGISHVYVIKFGSPDGPDVRSFGALGARVLVHAVFDGRMPHGDRFARIAPCVPGHGPCVPHIVRRPLAASGPDLRRKLRIPEDATVFGRHGGNNVFDIEEAWEAVVTVASQRPDIYFLLMNTDRFYREELPNIVFLPRSLDDAYKAAFIRSCDAMLHARHSGESFGLACAEFSVHNKPVITSSLHTDGGFASNHLDVLGDRGLYYYDAPSLIQLLLEFDRDEAATKEWNAYRQFEPRHVMATFKQVFLEDPKEGATTRYSYEEADRVHKMLLDTRARMPCCGK